MRFIPKKKKEEVEDLTKFESPDEGTIDLKSKKIKDRDFKDLKSENKKQRGEPKKPWGKKERLIVFLLFFLPAVFSLFFALSSREWKLPNFPQPKIPEINFPVIGNKTIILEGDGEDQKKALNIKNEFISLTKGLNGVYGFYVIRLENGTSYGVNEDRIFQAASLIKLPVIASAYKNAEAGILDLEQKYKLKNEDKVAGSGSLYGKPKGFEITYQNILDLMGKQSDNTAFNIIRKNLGDGYIKENLISFGMTKTSLEENLTTPYEIGTFFENLYKNNIVTKENKIKILESLTDTVYEAWIPAGIPQNVKVAHKFGREVHVVNDGGIVYAKEPFTLVIMSEGIVEKEADEVFPKIAKMVYEIEVGE